MPWAAGSAGVSLLAAHGKGTAHSQSSTAALGAAELVTPGESDLHHAWVTRHLALRMGNNA